jgi:thymidylate kinase
MSDVGIRPTGARLADSLVPTPHPILLAAFAALDEADIVWCLLRGEADLDRPDQEVDLLVDEVDADRLVEALGARGFAELAAWGRGSHRPFVGFDSTHDAWPKLDVVTRIDFGALAEMETGAAAQLLARRTRVGDVAMLAEGDRFWALLLHCILDRGDIPERHAKPLRGMADLAETRPLDGPLAAWFEANAPRGWDGPRIIGLVRQGQWSSLVALGQEVRAAGATPGRSGTKRLVRSALRRLTKLRTAVRQPGLSMALLGTDGVGKSTMASELGRSFYFPVRSVYMGLYGAGPSGRAPRGLVGRLARLWVGYARAAYHRRRGRLVVYDRFGYDVLLRNPRQVGWRSGARRWLLGKAIPSPDMAILLDAPAEVLAGRKNEHRIGELRSLRHAYLALAQRIDAPVVGTDRAPDETRRELTALIWQRYVDRSLKRAARHR